MKIPIMNKYVGYVLVPQKIDNIKEQNMSNQIFGDKKIKLYWYTRKQLKNKIKYGYVEI